MILFNVLELLSRMIYILSVTYNLLSSSSYVHTTHITHIILYTIPDGTLLTITKL